MPLKKIDPTSTSAWKKLHQHFKVIRSGHMNDWFAENPQRANDFTIKWQNFLVDYSKNRITGTTKKLLLELAEEIDLKDAIQKQFSGDFINETEKRAVLHTQLRSKNPPEEVKITLEKIEKFSSEIISGNYLGYTGKKITDIVNIGIGGSDLGPHMVVDALKYYKNHLNIHFISSVDGDDVAETLQQLPAETTLFIVVSKSFSTQETLTNATTAKKWLINTASEEAVKKHFIAVSANVKKAEAFGVDSSQIFPMWNWVGGRFSLWSAVGLSISCAVGFQNFKKLLEGAQKMDDHFYKADFSENIPVILALLSVWYNNFFDAETEAVIPYSQYLQRFVPYLQQGIMESNGKSISRAGEKINYPTGTIIWGGTGTNAQHAFFQHIHQGTKLIPCDFIGFKNSLHENKAQHTQLMANYFAQTEALLKGKSANETADFLAPFKIFEGNKPSNTILIKKLTPENLGSLIALYEHKLFVQGVIWNIFSYDQWGVQLGKELATDILSQFKNQAISTQQSSSTQELLAYFLKD